MTLQSLWPVPATREFESLKSAAPLYVVGTHVLTAVLIFASVATSIFGVDFKQLLNVWWSSLSIKHPAPKPASSLFPRSSKTCSEAGLSGPDTASGPVPCSSDQRLRLARAPGDLPHEWSVVADAVDMLYVDPQAISMPNVEDDELWSDPSSWPRSVPAKRSAWMGAGYMDNFHNNYHDAAMLAHQLVRGPVDLNQHDKVPAPGDVKMYLDSDYGVNPWSIDGNNNHGGSGPHVEQLGPAYSAPEFSFNSEFSVAPGPAELPHDMLSPTSAGSEFEQEKFLPESTPPHGYQLLLNEQAPYDGENFESPVALPVYQDRVGMSIPSPQRQQRQPQAHAYARPQQETQLQPHVHAHPPAQAQAQVRPQRLSPPLGSRPPVPPQHVHALYGPPPYPGSFDATPGSAPHAKVLTTVTALHSPPTSVSSHSLSPTYVSPTSSPEHHLGATGRFQCRHCSAEFRIKGYLTRHMKKHAEQKAYTCPFFDPNGSHRCHPTGGFSRRDTFKTHLKSRHFVYPPNTSCSNRTNVPGWCRHALP